MDFKILKLPNGLRVITTPMPGLESATVTVWVKTGSRFEEKRINGISHFLEHMVFKGSEKRPSAREISEAVDGMGAEFNAATSKDWTNFYIKVRSSHLEDAMDVLSDMVLRPLLKEDEVEREKGTIIQELNMYEDTPVAKIGDVFESLAFASSPLAWDIGGDEKSVKAIKREDFLNYRDIHYHPESMFVSVAGGVTPSEVERLAEKYFGQVKASDLKSQAVSKFENKQNKPQFKLKNKKVEQAHLILGFMSEGRGYEGRFAQSILSTILSGPMSSRLFIEVRERRGLAYAVKPSADKFEEIGYLGVYAGVALNKCEEAIKVIMDQIYGLRDGKYPITDKELTKTKEYVKGQIGLSLEDTIVAGDFFTEQAMFLPSILTPSDIYDRLDKVTKEDVLKEAEKLFDKNRLNLSIIGPYTNEDKFTKIIS